MGTKIRLLISFLFLAILNACGGGGSGLPAEPPTEAMIGPEGGSITSTDGLVTLAIPAGALAAPTSISMQRFYPEVGDAWFYEFLPSGLQFQVPAKMTVNVAGLMPDSNAENLSDISLPLILTANEAGDGLVTLDNLELTDDADARTFTLSGDVSHFSRYVIGEHLALEVSVDGVPQFWPANTAFNPITVTVRLTPLDEMVHTNGEVLDESILNAHYVDSSQAPVQYTEEFNPFALDVQQITFGGSGTTPIHYGCGDPGVGTYHATLNFDIYKKTAVGLKPETVSIEKAFLFGALGSPIEGGQPIYSTDTFTFTLTGIRKVNCGGSTPVGDGSSGGTTGGGTTGGDTTGGGTTTGGSTGGGSTATAPTISSNTSQISIDHTYGQSACPTVGQNFSIFYDTPNDVDITVNENLPFLDVSPSSTTASGGSAVFTPSFPCSGYSFGDNMGVINITAQDKVTGLTSNTLSIPVTVSVHQ